jgi:predicted ATP-grasp superfamily ATP-dependent carboligase
VPNTNGSESSRFEFLAKLGKELGEAVLFPVSDDDVLLCSRFRNELERNYHFVMTDHATINSVLTKDGLHKIASLYDIPAPNMFPASSHAEVKNIASSLSYPVILKPVFSPSWLHGEIVSLLRNNFLSGPPKVAFCQNAQILLETYSKIAVFDPNMIIEEVIPGEDERLAYYCFYLDRHSRPLAGFAGKKLRVLPIGFGSASFVRSFYDPELEELSQKLLSCIHYQGLGGIEFKKDARDEKYKLIEFNARFGMWDSLSTRCGIDIPYIAYCDALDWQVESQSQYRKDVLWIDFQRDVRAFIILNQRKQLSFKTWLKSFSGEKEWAIYSRDDWKPALTSFWILLERPRKSIKSKLSSFSFKK